VLVKYTTALQTLSSYLLFWQSLSINLIILYNKLDMDIEVYIN